MSVRRSVRHKIGVTLGNTLARVGHLERLSDANVQSDASVYPSSSKKRSTGPISRLTRRRANASKMTSSPSYTGHRRRHRRAMMKIVRRKSNGTVLTTSWDEAKRRSSTSPAGRHGCEELANNGARQHGRSLAPLANCPPVKKLAFLLFSCHVRSPSGTRGNRPTLLPATCSPPFRPYAPCTSKQSPMRWEHGRQLRRTSTRRPSTRGSSISREPEEVSRYLAAP